MVRTLRSTIGRKFINEAADFHWLDGDVHVCLDLVFALDAYF